MFAQHRIDWRVGHTQSASGAPLKYVPAAVPGAVQLDWAAAEGWALPENDNDVGRYSWMEDEYWLYKGKLSFDEPGPGKRLFFVCKGIDYKFEIRCSGKILLEQEGMFAPVELDLSGIAVPGGEIEILVHPAPKSHRLPVDNHQPNQSCKPAVSYGWDFHPRLVPMGIWDEVRLETRPVLHLGDCDIGQRLDDDCLRAELTLSAALSGTGVSIVVWELFDPAGMKVFRKEAPASESSLVIKAVVDSPELWWPNGSGTPSLYRNEISIVDSRGGKIQTVIRKIGFRNIRLVMAPGGWDDPETNRIPKGPNKAPITLEVNGRRIFGKGSNWVSPDIFPGRLSAKYYTPLLELAKNGHFNLLRCWGGAVVQKDEFFDICDELGIMVWQEFPLACNRYEGTPGYLEVLNQESRSVIKRLRHHACLAIWCGGNELFNAWSRMTVQDKAMRLLDSNCYTLDPDRAFMMTSPLHGMGHGHYRFRIEDGRDVFQYFQDSRCTAYAEFGVPAPADAVEIKRLIPRDEPFPPTEKSDFWRQRHGFQAWDGSKESWLEISCIRHYFGEPKDLEGMVRDAQILQAEGLKSMFEEARRQQPVCGMALNWCFNEPWPAAANNSIVQWNRKPKPGYSGVKAALRPMLASARIRKFDWSSGEEFDPEIWILNDSFAEIKAGKVKTAVFIDDSSLAEQTWDFPAAAGSTNVKGPVLKFPLPKNGWSRLKLKLSVAGLPDWDSEYLLLRKR